MAAPEPDAKTLALIEKHPAEYAIYKKLDTNGDGIVSKEEIWVKLTCKGDEFADQMMSMVDKNGDGNIGFDEFCEAFSQVKGFKDIMDTTRSVIPLTDLTAKMDSVWESGKIPFVVDPSGRADTFMKYNTKQIDVKGQYVLDKIHNKTTAEERTEQARKDIIAAVKNGQQLHFAMGKGCPDLAPHKAGLGVHDDYYGIFQHGFSENEAEISKLVKEEDKESGIFCNRGCQCVVSTQFSAEDFQEFLNGHDNWKWPWDNFHFVMVAQD